MKERLPLLRGAGIFLLISILVFAFLISGCGRDEPRRQYYPSAPKARPFPGTQVQQARDTMDQGYELFRQALNCSDQGEKNILVDKALNNYYFPAQETLERLKTEYPEHASDIDSLHQVLSQRIGDATKIRGTGD